MSAQSELMEPVVDVCILYDLACANCGKCDDIDIHADLGVTLCDAKCLQAYLDSPSIRNEPILTDVQQHFWSDEKQGYIIAASFSSFKRKTKAKASKAKAKAKDAKERAKKRLEKAKEEAKEKRDNARRKGQDRAEEAKSKVKKGSSTAKSKAKEGASKTKGALEEAGAGGDFAPETDPEDLLTEDDFDSPSEYEDYVKEQGLAREVFSLRYLLNKHEFFEEHLDAEQLMRLRQFFLAKNFGTFMLEFAISALAEEQGRPAIATQIRDAMEESEARLIVSK